MIERILLLIRNLLHVSSDPQEEKVRGRGTQDRSHDRVGMSHDLVSVAHRG